MLKYVVAVLCGISLSGSVYMAGWGAPPTEHKTIADAKNSDACEACDTPMVVLADVTPGTSTKVAAVDVKNTKCIVMPEDAVGTATVEYKGKIYHTCCPDCIKDFNKEPEKYVKAFEANPAKFGVK